MSTDDQDLRVNEVLREENRLLRMQLETAAVNKQGYFNARLFNYRFCCLLACTQFNGEQE